MALNLDTQDIQNYPGTVKRVTVDQSSMVPTGYEGDEKIVMVISTTAYSDNDNLTSIQSLYVTDFKAGWCKSSGFAGSNGKFYLDATHKTLGVKLDATVSGSGDGYYDITLEYNTNGTPISGEAVAADMEEKIRALTMVTADTGFSLAYKNCSVEYNSGKFLIISGSMGSFYTGSKRSSVSVRAGSTNDCSTVLGFDLPQTSEALAAIAVKEAILGANYTAGTDTLTIGAGTGVAAGDALMIKDAVNTDYFTALSGTTDTAVKVAVEGTNGFDGIVNDYTTTSGAKIQILREQDPEGYPTMYYTNIDSIARWGIKSLVNQIDYS